MPATLARVIPLILKEETGSTNDDLWDLLDGGRRLPVALLAGRQTSGRGRQGKVWHSGSRGNLCLSVLLFMKPGAAGLAPYLPLGAALASAEVLRRYTRSDLALKWPNDLMIGERKCGGVLAETRSGIGRPTIPVVVGIGLNLNADPQEYPEEVRRSAAAPAPPAGGPFPVVDIARQIIYTLERRLQENGLLAGADELSEAGGESGGQTAPSNPRLEATWEKA